MKGENTSRFYDEEVEKCMKMSWQINAKFNALILLLENGVKASRLIELNEQIAFELVKAITERSTACLVSAN